jgi:hypothetical protein
MRDHAVHLESSLRAERSNPDLDKAISGLLRRFAPRNDDLRALPSEVSMTAYLIALAQAGLIAIAVWRLL